MTAESNVNKAVELLRTITVLERLSPSGNDRIHDAIALLSPPPLSRDERIARELDVMGEYPLSGPLNNHIRNIASILREPK